MEGMIGLIEELQRRALAQAFDHRLELAELGQRVARALQEQHRYVNLREMIGALSRRLARRMQWKTEKDKTFDTVERFGSLRARCHAPAKGFAAGKKRQL